MNRPPSATHDAARTVEAPSITIESLVMAEHPFDFVRSQAPERVGPVGRSQEAERPFVVVARRLEFGRSGTEVMSHGLGPALASGQAVQSRVALGAVGNVLFQFGDLAGAQEVVGE